jgi:hypothetical protein
MRHRLEQRLARQHVPEQLLDVNLPLRLCMLLQLQERRLYQLVDQLLTDQSETVDQCQRLNELMLQC